MRVPNASHARPRQTRLELDRASTTATAALLAAQRDDGHWVFELEADVTISAEYIALHAFPRRARSGARSGIARYLRRRQGAHGGWPLVHGGPFNISASVKAYFALKLAGDAPDDAHMRRRATRSSRTAAPATSTCSRASCSRCTASCRGRRCRSIPVELMLLPRWFPFHLSRVSYWTRTVLVPLLVLQALKPRARNPHDVRIDELFPDRAAARASVGARTAPVARCDSRCSPRSTRCCIGSSRSFPRRIRQRAIERAVAFVNERAERRRRPRRHLSGDGERGDDVRRARPSARARGSSSLRAQGDRPLLVVSADEAYCQPCVSPVWDTALACHALLDVGGAQALSAARKRPVVARAAAGARHGGRLDGSSARTCGRAAGRSSTRTRTIPTSTTPRWS